MGSGREQSVGDHYRCRAKGFPPWTSIYLVVVSYISICYIPFKYKPIGWSVLRQHRWRYRGICIETEREGWKSFILQRESSRTDGPITSNPAAVTTTTGWYDSGNAKWFRRPLSKRLISAGATRRRRRKKENGIEENFPIPVMTCNEAQWS